MKFLKLKRKIKYQTIDEASMFPTGFCFDFFPRSWFDIESVDFIERIRLSRGAAAQHVDPVFVERKLVTIPEKTHTLIWKKKSYFLCSIFLIFFRYIKYRNFLFQNSDFITQFFSGMGISYFSKANFYNRTSLFFWNNICRSLNFTIKIPSFLVRKREL